MGSTSTTTTTENDEIIQKNPTFFATFGCFRGYKDPKG